MAAPGKGDGTGGRFRRLRAHVHQPSASRQAVPGRAACCARLRQYPDSAMLIRPARVDEAVLLSSIAFESKSLWGYGRAQLEQWRADLTVSGEQIAACPTWVAEAEGRIAGFCMLAPALPHWQLEHLWVRPECAGAGVGRFLLGKAASLAASSKAASLAASSEAASLAASTPTRMQRRSTSPAAPRASVPSQRQSRARLSAFARSCCLRSRCSTRLPDPQPEGGP